MSNDAPNPHPAPTPPKKYFYVDRSECSVDAWNLLEYRRLEIMRLNAEIVKLYKRLCKYEGHLPITDKDDRTRCELCESEISGDQPAKYLCQSISLSKVKAALNTCNTTDAMARIVDEIDTLYLSGEVEVNDYLWPALTTIVSDAADDLKQK